MQKRNKLKINKKEIKIYSKVYTKFLSFPLFLGSEDESYFTILTLSIYTVKRNWAESPKSSRWNSQKKAQLIVLCRDLKLMSRPLLMSISFLLVATSVLCCNQFSSFNLYSRSRPHVVLSLAARSPNCSKVVATLISSPLLFFRSRPE